MSERTSIEEQLASLAISGSFTKVARYYESSIAIQSKFWRWRVRWQLSFGKNRPKKGRL